MDTSSLTEITGLLIALSVASERLVEIIKGLVPFLNNESPNPTVESLRRVSLQVLAVGAGMATAFVARPAIPETLIPRSATGDWPVLALGLLASGGSGFWNSLLSYLQQAKNAKELLVREMKGMKQTSLAQPTS